MNAEVVRQRAAEWMIARGWRKKLAKRCLLGWAWERGHSPMQLEALTGLSRERNNEQ